MKKKYFGTGGIRGRFNTFPMTAKMALKVGMAVGILLKQEDEDPVALIGQDTRISGNIITNAITAGINSVGVNTVNIDVATAPCVSTIVRSGGFDFGIVISASHNPYYDNGIKILDCEGFGITDNVAIEIEKAIDCEKLDSFLVDSENIGTNLDIADIHQNKYIDFVIKDCSPDKLNLSSLKIVLDSANGAAYKIAPSILKKLKAKLINIANEPDGFNINEKCGSTDLELLIKTVKKEKADLGIALDGDADRVMIIDEKGKVIDGDKIIAIIAKEMLENKKLENNTVILTKMANLGLEQYLNKSGIKTIRTDIGEKYVFEHLKKGTSNIGGEPNGHIMMYDYGSTGDGIIAALQVLGVFCKMQKSNSKIKMSDLANLYKTVPQKLFNIEYDNSKPTNDSALGNSSVKKEIEKYTKELKNDGRILIRKSGTQPLIRVMVECADEKKLDKALTALTNAIKKVLK